MCEREGGLFVSVCMGGEVVCVRGRGACLCQCVWEGRLCV